MTVSSDVIVVGGGAVGASVAYELVKRGVAVTIIERDSIASHASGFAYGGLFPTMGAGIPGPVVRHAKRGISLHKRLAPELEEATGMYAELRAVGRPARAATRLLPPPPRTVPAALSGYVSAYCNATLPPHECPAMTGRSSPSVSTKASMSPVTVGKA